MKLELTIMTVTIYYYYNMCFILTTWFWYKEKMSDF